VHIHFTPYTNKAMGRLIPISHEVKNSIPWFLS